MHFRVIVANLLLSATIFNCIQPVTAFASEFNEIDYTEEIIDNTVNEHSSIVEDVNNVENDVDGIEEITEDETESEMSSSEHSETYEIEEVLDETIDNAVSNVPDLTTQVSELYEKIGASLNIDYKYVKLLHLLSGGKAVYADKKPNIYLDETVKTMDGPFYIAGSNTEYMTYQQIECPDQNIERPSSNYLPDAAYSVTYDIVQLMNDRLNYDRGGSQIYFDSLKSSAKKEIIFTEAVMLYTGETEEAVNNYYMIYEKLLYDKSKGETLVNISDGSIKIKDKYLETFRSNGINNEQTLKYISIILSFDSELVNNDSSESLSDEYVLPYIPNYTSRENMMIAATCLNGKVRYVWGGGHSGLSYIDGINPIWMTFEDLYADEPYTQVLDENTGEITNVANESYGRCIKPSGSWCPNHGSYSGGCSFSGPIVRSLDEYIEHMDNYIDTSEMRTEKYARLMEDVNFNRTISVDTLNGFDCSGYVSWLYNQITDRYNISTTAANFSTYPGLQSVSFGDRLLPGDIFAWDGHIVAIIGRVSNSDNVYVTTESTPNILRFGIVYYNGASRAEIEQGKEIAKQANQLIGNLYGRENPHVYCMNNYLNENGRMGRLRDRFVDENMIISDYGKTMKDMYAQEIIQYILRKLPYSYVIGYNQYEGNIFDKSVVATGLGLN